MHLAEIVAPYRATTTSLLHRLARLLHHRRHRSLAEVLAPYHR